MILDNGNSGNKNDVTVRTQRTKYIPTPVDSNLINCRMMQTTTITLAKLLKENIDLTVNKNK